MALVGYEQQKLKIDEKIREIKGLLGGDRKMAASSNGAASPSAQESTPTRKRTLSAEARKRIATAQKRRWAEHRKKLSQAE